MRQEEFVQFELQPAKGLVEGVTVSEDGKSVEIVFFAKEQKECQLVLYQNKAALKKIKMFPCDSLTAPDLYGIRLVGEGICDFLQQCEYAFETGKQICQDPYMKATAGRNVFGKRGKLRGKFDFSHFDWQGENRKKVPFEDMILYQCHLRGFTRHSSSAVEAPGTYLGFCEKLKELEYLGINTIVFLPLYDFNEIMEKQEGKINYWGYTEDACYFAPKASYASCPERAVEECKTMIRRIHQMGMNVIFDMHFQKCPPQFILRCLRYYVMEYHVDGFLIDTSVVSEAWLSQDPILRQCKFLGAGWKTMGQVAGQRTVAEFNDAYQTVARRYLKSDEGQVAGFYEAFCRDAAGCAGVHYITQKNGFTLRDLVSYDIKHNEANGEKNQDGTQYNYSWNCGQEGSSRKKSVLQMRRKQTKNALAMLLLGLASPMILAGDEFGQTQRGNNNAYCQDNATTWLHWNLIEKNKDIYDFVRHLIAFRKEHALYHRRETMMPIDSKGYGIPAISAHGIEPWEADFSYYSRDLGILFYGAYYGGNSIYMIFNMHWESHTFFFPALEKDKRWKCILDTGRENAENEIVVKKYKMESRSIAVFECIDTVKTPENPRISKKKIRRKPAR
ncbi:MAG: hypothetical protein PUC49_07680 [Clostridiales bacterium]|nr:hypothetical protein [Clostridiales bacterium]